MFPALTKTRAAIGVSDISDEVARGRSTQTELGQITVAEENTPITYGSERRTIRKYGPNGDISGIPRFTEEDKAVVQFGENLCVKIVLQSWTDRKR